MEEIKNDLHWLMFYCFGAGFVFCLALWINWPSKKKAKKRKLKYPKCDCKDVNQCYKWCNAKHLFKIDSDNGLV
jgi:hypothetical protein